MLRMVAEPLEWRKYDDAELPRVLEAALEAFAKHGYHGTSIRELASTAGLSVPGLYHHYPSKQDILVALLEDVMRDLVQRTPRRWRRPDRPPRRASTPGSSASCASTCSARSTRS